MGELYEDKYYPKCIDEIITENNEILDFYDKYDSLHGILDIPTIFDLEKLENGNNNCIISNKSILLSEKGDNLIVKPLQSKTTKEKEKNPNLNLENQITKSFLSNKSKSTNPNTNTKSSDNKFKDANLRETCNKKILKNTLHLINNKIKELYNNNIGKGILIKQLLPLKKLESNIKYNKELLSRTIKDIFSDNIYGKITSYPKDYNKKLIENLLNEKDLVIKDIFNNLFGLKFIQCLEHYRGTKFYNELNGMKLFEEEEENYKNDEELYKNLKHYLNNYETIINNKKSRKSRNSK